MARKTQEQIATTMKDWQKMENDAITSTAQIMQNTENPIVRGIAEIIQRDSQMHYTVQGWINEAMNGTISLAPEELSSVWQLIDRHIKLEQRAIEFAENALASLKGREMPIQQYFLNYLLQDEKKHTDMLARLEKIKLGMYPF